MQEEEELIASRSGRSGVGILLRVTLFWLMNIYSRNEYIVETDFCCVDCLGEHLMMTVHGQKVGADTRKLLDHCFGSPAFRVRRTDRQIQYICYEQ